MITADAGSNPNRTKQTVRHELEQENVNTRTSKIVAKIQQPKNIGLNPPLRASPSPLV